MSKKDKIFVGQVWKSKAGGYKIIIAAKRGDYYETKKTKKNGKGRIEYCSNSHKLNKKTLLLSFEPSVL